MLAGQQIMGVMMSRFHIRVSSPDPPPPRSHYHTTHQQLLRPSPIMISVEQGSMMMEMVEMMMQVQVVPLAFMQVEVVVQWW